MPAAATLLILALSLAMAETARFPTVSGKNLEGRAMTLPADFAGARNVVFVAFKRDQQALVDTWVPFVKATVARTAGTEYYEVPTIGPVFRLLQWTIDRGMRRGIADPKARERTITLYLEKAPFKRSLGITSEDTIHVLVVDRQGQVLWRETGGFDEAKGVALAQVLSPPMP